MFFETSNSCFNKTGYYYYVLIGYHNQFIYSAHFNKEKHVIYKKQICETHNWEYVTSFYCKSINSCNCKESASAAFGILNDELYIACNGFRNRNFGFHLLRYHLQTNLKSFFYFNDKNYQNICNICSSSYIIENPFNPDEFILKPWFIAHSTNEVNDEPSISFCQSSFSICNKKKTISLKKKNSFTISGTDIRSNIGFYNLSSCIYIQNNKLFLHSNVHKTEIQITQKSEFKYITVAAFYNYKKNLYCISLSKPKNASICTRVHVFKIDINENFKTSNFIKIMTLSECPIIEDPRYYGFIMINPKKIIFADCDTLYIFSNSVPTLSEICYKNLSRNLKTRKRPLKYSAEMYYGISQKKIKQYIGVSNSYNLVNS